MHTYILTYIVHYEHEAIRIPKSENNIGAPSAPQKESASAAVSAISVEKSHEIKQKLEDYHKASVVCLPDQHGVLFGIEIATGIADCLIDRIVNTLPTCTIDYLLQLGLPHQHAVTMHDIVVSSLNN